MKIAIVEDEQAYAQQLQEYLKQYQEEFDQRLEVSCFDNGISFIHGFKRQFDVILLDVSMPYIDGIETARKIREVDTDVVILFVTNQAQHAIRGYEVDAMDYILKPISYFVFSQRLNRALSRVKRREQACIVINPKGGPRKLKIDHIYYIESQGHNLIVHTAEGEFSVFGNMKALEQRLEQHGFMRCNKGYLVALRHVDNVVDGCVVVQGRQLLISRPRKAAFMEALTNYFGAMVQ